MRDLLVFGPALAGAPPSAGIEALPDTAEVCGCNGVNKGQVLGAIAEHGLTTLDAVRARTKASASCGSCTGKVEALLGFALGAEYAAAPAVKPICKCTAHDHDSVRAAIVEQYLLTVPAVMRALQWTT